MSRNHVHFLGNINHDNWAGHVGTMLLLSFGPESRQQLRAQYDTLTGLPILKGVELDSSELIDFRVRQVLICSQASDELDELREQAKDADNPVPVPGHLLAELLALAERQDELLINHLPLYRPGRLEVSVGLSDMFQGRSFGMDGGIDLARLAEPAESEEQAAANRRHSHFLGVIADKKWQQQPGTAILIELGPGARAAVTTALARLQHTTEDESADITGQELQDFSVRQVAANDGMDRLSGGVVGRFEREAKKSPGPIALPGDKMKHVLLLTDEYDELRPTRIAVTRAGTLEVSVSEVQYHDGQSFAVTGGIAVEKLAPQ